MDSWSEKASSLPVVEITDSCWLWHGTCSSEGYARFYTGQNDLGRSTYQYVHRLSFELFKGQIEDGLEIDHLCRVRNCINPEHMEVVTRSVNVLRGIGPPALNARKDHCIHGHPLSGDNLRVQNRKRWCRECDRLKHLEARRSRKH